MKELPLCQPDGGFCGFVVIFFEQRLIIFLVQHGLFHILLIVIPLMATDMMPTPR